MDKELQNYWQRLAEKEEEWESLCLRCGACCGAYDDPCLHLKKNQDSKFYCEIYPKRFGVRETKKGDQFRCVPIKELIDGYWKKDRRCVYKQIKKNKLNLK